MISFALDSSSPFSPSAGFTPTVAEPCNLTAAMETILVGLIALALLVYLTVAMLRPEKF
jgi:K+-transporting ATPase KdpF subunit